MRTHRGCSRPLPLVIEMSLAGPSQGKQQDTASRTLLLVCPSAPLQASDRPAPHVSAVRGLTTQDFPRYLTTLRSVQFYALLAPDICISIIDLRPALASN